MAFRIPRAGVSLVLAAMAVSVSHSTVRAEDEGPAIPVAAKPPPRNPPEKPPPHADPAQQKDRLAALRAAVQALQEAQRAISSADSEDEKRAAREKLDRVRKQLDDIRKRFPRQPARPNRPINARPPTQIYLSQIPGRNSKVPDDVSPDDPKARFLLLTAAGPVVVEATMLRDGKPFRAAREAIIDDMLQAADRDGDGKPTWDEALATVRFTLGRITSSDDRHRATYSRMFDDNADGLVDRDEVRHFVARYFGGGAFQVVTGRPSSRVRTIIRLNGRIVSRNGNTLNLMTLLDGNGDGALSATEMNAAGDKLKKRDTDDNDLLDPQEVDGSADSHRGQSVIISRSFRYSNGGLALHLGPGIDANSLYQSLWQQYGISNKGIPAERFSGVPGLFASLDENSDGELQPEETLRFNEIRPHVSLSMNLTTGKPSSGIELTSSADAFSNVKNERGSASLELPGAKLVFAVNPAVLPNTDYSRAAAGYLNRLDRDNSGFLDKKELTGSYARMMERWDADRDGKVFPQEIVDAYERMQTPQRSQIRAYIVNHGNSLFQSLDVSGDGRLSLREMMTAQKRIADYDKDHDGHISRAEIPSTISVTFSLGNAPIQADRPPGFAAKPSRKPKPTDPPAWFTRMDRNGDGDLTLKEFLGSEDQFARLDLNDDGFIVPAEALAAETHK